MGKRGPARTPKNALETRGSWRAKARAGAEPVAGLPPMPQWWEVDERRNRYWNYYTQELLAMGCLATCDYAHVVLLVDACAEFEEASLDLAENGRTFLTDKGYEGPRPAVTQKKNAETVMARIAQQLGLSASARTEVTPIGSSKSDDKASKFGIAG